MNPPSLLDAIRVVKRNEEKARDSYAKAMTTIKNQAGRHLFEQLKEFEHYHFEKLTELEKSLEETGGFIDYKGREFPLPPVFVIKAAKDLGGKTIMKIVVEAMELEQEAKDTYANLSEQISDPQGQKMFSRLSDEEYNHYRILKEAYWTLSNLGVWKWSRL